MKVTSINIGKTQYIPINEAGKISKAAIVKKQVKTLCFFTKNDQKE